MAQGVEQRTAAMPDKEKLDGVTPDAENRMPTRLAATIFRGKALALQLRRGAQDSLRGLRRYPCARPGNSNATSRHEADNRASADFTHVVAESRTPLFTDASSAERALQWGKVQNLRCALRRLHGMQLPAGDTFSFWKQVGRATRSRGYVAGRQLQEGCLFPAIGGGLCQLSNALYDVALQANCEILERHPHTRIVPGSAAAQDRDAAIAWNYIDLRFRAPVPLRLEAVLTQTELVVRLKTTVNAVRPALSSRPGSAIPLLAVTDRRALLNVQEHSCVTCGAEACFRQTTVEVQELRNPALHTKPAHRTAYLVDMLTPEFAAYLQEQPTADALLFLPLDGARWKLPRYAWPTAPYQHVHSATLLTLQRALVARIAANGGAARRRLAQLDGAERLAAHFAQTLPWDVTHVVVAQSLLPYLWRDGHLGGRTFDVLMTQLPMAALQTRLDAAFAAHPDRKLLRDFRADAILVGLESAALQAARHVVTPHTAIATLFPRQAVRLPWRRQFPLSALSPSLPTSLPTSLSSAANVVRIAFPGPTHARKGAYELRAVARALNLEVVLTGSELEGETFWQGISTRRFSKRDTSEHKESGDWLNGVRVVVQPALIEEQPRRLLEALARGVPVIATPACGLGDLPGVTTIPAGDEKALCEAIVQLLFPSL